MSLKIRLSRIGRKNLPAYKIVVANTRDKRNGRSLDILGHFNPSQNPQSYDMDKKKFDEWVSKGAQVTKAVEDLIAGKYKFEPYKRQNEGGEEKAKEKMEEAVKEAKESKEENIEEMEEKKEIEKKTEEDTEENKKEEKENSEEK